MVPDPGGGHVPSQPQKVSQTVPCLFVSWPPLTSPLAATHSQGPRASLIALAVSHVVQNGSKPIVSLTPPGSSLCSRPSHCPIAHSLTPAAGLTLSTPPFYRPIANILTASAVLHSSATPSDFPGQILTVSSPPQVLLCASPSRGPIHCRLLAAAGFHFFSMQSQSPIA